MHIPRDRTCHVAMLSNLWAVAWFSPQQPQCVETHGSLHKIVNDSTFVACRRGSTIVTAYTTARESGPSNPRSSNPRPIASAPVNVQRQMQNAPMSRLPHEARHFFRAGMRDDPPPAGRDGSLLSRWCHPVLRAVDSRYPGPRAVLKAIERLVDGYESDT
jgi:hypothetical protein